VSDEQGSGHGTESDDVERLKAERDELRRKVETLETPKPHRVRRVLTPILVALAVIVFTITVPAAWGRRTVLNTDRYVATVAPLGEDPAVQQSIATRVTNQVFTVLNVQGVLSENLPEQIAFLAVPLTSAIRGFVQDRVLAIVQSDGFETFWVEANRFVHTQLLEVLRGETDTVSVVEGKVLLNLVPLVNLALGSIQTVASDLIGRDVTLPTIEPGEPVGASVAKLEQALGIDLPDTYGSVEVWDSEDLAALQQALDLFQRGLVLLLLLIPILGGLALWLSLRKRRTLIQLMAGAAIGLVLVRRLAIMGRDHLFDQVDVQRFPSVRVLTDQLMDSLFRYTGVLLAIVLVVLLVALVSGPYPWAVAIRRWVGDAARGVGAAVSGAEMPDTGRVRWLREHRDGLMLGTAALAVALLFLLDLSFLGFLILVVVFALVEVALWRLGGEPEPAEAGAT
jgi:hypothetical protein